jgi:hypothetical protein
MKRTKQIASGQIEKLAPVTILYSLINGISVHRAWCKLYCHAKIHQNQSTSASWQLAIDE